MGMGGVLRTLPCHWVNHPDDLVRAAYKPYQLSLALRCGLRIPRTLVTNDAREARAFFEECSGRVVYKSLGAGVLSTDPREALALYTSQVRSEDLAEEAEVRATACLFQEEVAKQFELRVTVVGDSLFTAALHSQECEAARVDWRRGVDDLRHTTHELPSAVAAQCLALVRRLRLRFAAIDMILTPDGGYVFLEVNPNGQWAWLEHVTDLDIHGALVKELTRPPTTGQVVADLRPLLPLEECDA